MGRRQVCALRRDQVVAPAPSATTDRSGFVQLTVPIFSPHTHTPYSLLTNLETFSKSCHGGVPSITYIYVLYKVCILYKVAIITFNASFFSISNVQPIL